MKKLILFSLLFYLTNTFAESLDEFNEIRETVISGKDIHIVVDFSKCSSPEITRLTNIGVFTPNAVQVLNSSLVTSLQHFTLNHPTFPDRPVYEFVRYKISNDNTIALTAQVLDALNYAPLSAKLSLNCKLGTGAKVYG